MSASARLRVGRRRPWSAGSGDFSPLSTGQEDKARCGHEGNFPLLEREAWWVPCVGERINVGELRGVAAKFWSGTVGPLCQWQSLCWPIFGPGAVGPLFQ